MPAKGKRADELDARLTQPGVWDDPKRAGQMAREAAENREQIATWDRLERRARDVVELEQLGEDDPELEKQVADEQASVEKELRSHELDLLFTDQYANHNAVVTISVGQGGVEAQDWVEMLLRMYLKWAERRDFETEMIDESRGEEAGLKSVTFIVRGARAYGLLRSEHGVHRLVRISPFDQNHRRHTSFALVEVMPELESTDEAAVVINPQDLRIDTYRSTGAGGQHVNKTDSAVRITHLPTGIVVTCQNERSQMKNREMAMKVLKARLFQRQQQEAAEHLDQIRGQVMPAEFGSQIRNYVLQPYTLVKDVRTGLEVGNAQAVLDGEIDPFIESWLRWRLSKNGATLPG
ncbi:MAG: peptide chain release factor 2 [Chloroflexi bacterium]|nr:MAG: peptide chain release factor 2 [Chloroflexota bacterium]TMD70971.1 MAG: peptide chain release factor 2 [Chloroflexota bacterium]